MAVRACQHYSLLYLILYFSRSQRSIQIAWFYSAIKSFIVRENFDCGLRNERIVLSSKILWGNKQFELELASLRWRGRTAFFRSQLVEDLINPLTLLMALVDSSSDKKPSDPFLNGDCSPSFKYEPFLSERFFPGLLFWEQVLDFLDLIVWSHAYSCCSRGSLLSQHPLRDERALFLVNDLWGEKHGIWPWLL